MRSPKNRSLLGVNEDFEDKHNAEITLLDGFFFGSCTIVALGCGTMRERTFCIIKPDAMLARQEGKIIDALLGAGFDIVQMRLVRLDRATAERFYEVHRGKPFWSELVELMTSGPIVAMVLEGENGVAALRRLIGATNPRQAERGTLRRRFGTSTTRNALHAADSAGNAAVESSLFFAPEEME